jgi:dipeptidyl aminopeptidase/acylaminoacyl peptidase
MRRMAAVAGGLLVCWGSLAACAAQGFTLAQVLSAPFNLGLEAAPKGGNLLWVANEEGRRNLYVAIPSGSGFTVRRLTDDSADDGIEIGNVTWAPDGEHIVYVRGGDFEFPERPGPNPDLLPQGVEQDVWVVAVDGGAPRKLAEGRTPAVSPDGSTVAYLKDDQIWIIDLRDPAAKAQQLLHTRGGIGGLRWSPDGKWLAFTSGRSDHGFVGVYSFAEKTLRYLDPSTDIDIAPVWSPDSRYVAFARTAQPPPGSIFKPQRSGPPWSIRVAEAATGAGHEIWRAADGPGSVFHPTEAEHQLYWTADGRIVFPWERTGWLHLYSVSASGGKAMELTPGDFEVDFVSMSADRRRLVYSSNQDDIDRRHLWEVAPDGGAPRELTHGDGLEVMPVFEADGTVAVLRSDVQAPLRAAVVGANGSLRDVAPQMMPAEFPAGKLVTPKPVIFTAADGMRIHGQLFLPAEDGQRRPALIFFHGGSRRQMLLGWHYMDYYSNAYGMNQYLASRGYVVLAVNYRSGTGYGLDFREALNYGAAGASEFNDVEGAGLYLRGRADVDPARIGVWGGSYGGYLTALALARASDMFAAGVDMHGVHDWNLELQNWGAYDPEKDPAAARIAWEASPLASVSGWRSPVLLIQGDDDRNVQFAQTVMLANALRAQGTSYEEHVFPDEIHGFLLHRDWLTAYTLEADFFDRKLKENTHGAVSP